MQPNINSSLESNELKRIHKALTTIVSMLIARKWISNNPTQHFDELIKNAGQVEIIDSTYIQCDDKQVAIKFYNYDLNTLKNDREIDTFISKYPNYHKILIVNNVSTKAEKQIRDTQNFEVFKISDIEIDIAKHHLVPKHELLTKEEIEQFKKEYKVKEKDLSRICHDDPMVKYLFAHKGDIIRINRINTNSLHAISYRLVVNKSVHEN